MAPLKRIDLDETVTKLKRAAVRMSSQSRAASEGSA
jgi:hypothetical protein